MKLDAIGIMSSTDRHQRKEQCVWNSRRIGKFNSNSCLPIRRMLIGIRFTIKERCVLGSLCSLKMALRLPRVSPNRWARASIVPPALSVLLHTASLSAGGPLFERLSATYQASFEGRIISPSFAMDRNVTRAKLLLRKSLRRKSGHSHVKGRSPSVRIHAYSLRPVFQSG